jgi:hypothetical protein
LDGKRQKKEGTIEQTIAPPLSRMEIPQGISMTMIELSFAWPSVPIFMGMD